VTVVEIDNVTAALWEYQGDKYYSWDRARVEEAIRRVNKGAFLLDEKKEDWLDRVMPENLNMANGNFCIIGQAYGTYSQYIGIPFGIESMDTSGSDFDSEFEEEAIEHGFLSEEEHDGEYGRETGVRYALLDRVWVYMLTQRRQKGRPVALKLPPPIPRNVLMNLLVEDYLLDEATLQASS
jgi:hypothetical protein